MTQIRQPAQRWVCRLTCPRMSMPSPGQGGLHGRSPRWPPRATLVRTWCGSARGRPGHARGKDRSRGPSRRRPPRSVPVASRPRPTRDTAGDCLDRGEWPPSNRRWPPGSGADRHRPERGRVVRRERVREDRQRWRRRGASGEAAVGALPRAGRGLRSSGDQKRKRLESFVGQLPRLLGSRQQAPRSEEIAASRSRSDPGIRRDGAEPGVEPEPAQPDHDPQNDKNRAIGFQLPAEPPLAIVQQVAAELVELALQLDVASIGGPYLPAVPVGRLLFHLRS